MANNGWTTVSVRYETLEMLAGLHLVLQAELPFMTVTRAQTLDKVVFDAWMAAGKPEAIASAKPTDGPTVETPPPAE